MKLLPQDMQRKAEPQTSKAKGRHAEQERTERKGTFSLSQGTDDTECLRTVSGGSLDVNEPQVLKHSVGYGYGA